MTTAVPELLQQLADAVGVATAARSLAAHRRAAQRRLLPAYHVTRTGDPAASVVPAMGLDEAWLTLEDGGETDLEVVDGQVQLPADLPWGYHTLHGRAGARRAETFVIAAPATCPQPGERQWGWMAQLSQLRSRQSWGMGDAADLRVLAERSVRELGAGFVVCNPLHAVTLRAPVQPSPYFPSSRRFTNPLYLRIEDVPEAADLDGPARARLDDLAAAARARNDDQRIDHALGLFRLSWIPEGAPTTDGTYVRYPGDALLAILALEARRAGAVMVGEDLGTVEEGVHEALRGSGILGSKVLYFEWEDGRRRPAEAYERLAMASVTTHDLPTALGWWRDAIVDLRVALDLFGEGRTEEIERAHTAAERAAMRELLRAEGLTGEDADEDELVLAMHAFLARTPSLLVAAAPADAVGDPRQPNLPGTVDEYPNWRLPLAEETDEGLRPVLLEGLLAHPGTRRLAEALRRDG